LALANEFLRLLDHATERRVSGIKRMVVPTKGPPMKFDKRRRDRLRGDPLDIASRILVRDGAKAEFDGLVGHRKLHHIGGRGARQRIEDLYDWAEKNFSGPIIYSFWKGKRCLYVGKAGIPRRLWAYKNSIYLFKADVIEIWPVKSAARLPAAECLAMHLFAPSDNQNKAARVRWGRTCRVCRLHDDLKEELDSLLRLRA